MSTHIYARIVNGIVAEPPITLNDPLTPAHLFEPDMTWVDVTAITPTPAFGMMAVNAGGVWTFTAAPAPQPAVPQIITIFQAKAALLANAGAEAGKTLLDDVGAWVGTQAPLLQLAWTEATTVVRTGSFVAAAQAHFGWTPAFLDGLFVAGSAIEA